MKKTYIRIIVDIDNEKESRELLEKVMNKVGKNRIDSDFLVIEPYDKIGPQYELKFRTYEIKDVDKKDLLNLLAADMWENTGEDSFVADKRFTKNICNDKIAFMWVLFNKEDTE